MSLIKGIIFKNSKPLSVSRFSDFIGEGTAKLDNDVYVHFWHSGKAHEEVERSFPDAKNVEYFATSYSFGALDTYDFDRLVKYGRFKGDLIRAATKYFKRSDSMKAFDALSVSTKKEIEAGLENDGFEEGTDFNWAGNELVFRHEAARRRAEGLISRKYIASSLGNTIVIKDSGFVGDDLSASLRSHIRYYINQGYSQEKIAKALSEGFPNVTAEQKKLAYERETGTKVDASLFDSVVSDNAIIPGEGKSWEGHPWGLYVDGGKKYRGFEIVSEENGLRKGVYRFYNFGISGIHFGNSARDGQFTEEGFRRLIAEGKVKLLDSCECEDDIVKEGSGYTNKGKEGTHGHFATKEEAAAQTRAMYANGYRGDSAIHDDNYRMARGYIRRLIERGLTASEVMKQLKKEIPSISPDEMRLAYEAETGTRFSAEGVRGLLDSVVHDDDETIAEIDLDNEPEVDGEQKVKLHTGGKVIEVEVESEEHEREERLGDSVVCDADKYVYQLKKGDNIVFNGQKHRITNITKSVLGGGRDVLYEISTSTGQKFEYTSFMKIRVVDSKKQFEVKDSKGKKYLVMAEDSDEAVKKVRTVNDAASLKQLADLINKALDKAEETGMISHSGAVAKAFDWYISVDIANAQDTARIDNIVRSLINVNSEARRTLKISTSSHEVFIERTRN